MPIAIKSIFVGKKTYIDELFDEHTKELAFHCRAKGIPTDVLVKTANKRYKDLVACEYKNGLVYPLGIGEEYSIVRLYEDFYKGAEIVFNLCDGSNPCFDMKKNFSIETKKEFIRKLKF